MITLSSSRAVLTLDPGRGGRLHTLTIDGANVIGNSVPVPGTPDGWYHGSFPLAPWAGARRGDTIDFDGATHHIGASMHGLSFDVPWSVVDESHLTYDLPSEWPFGGRLDQHYALTDTALTHTLLASNDYGRMPVVLGFHPWFPRQIAGRDAVVTFTPSRQFALGPGGVTSSTTLSARPWDAAFSGLDAGPTIAWPGAPTVTLSSSAPYWVYFDRAPDAFCIEPWTAPPGALGTPLGQVAAPGAPVRLEFRISWDD